MSAASVPPPSASTPRSGGEDAPLCLAHNGPSPAFSTYLCNLPAGHQGDHMALRCYASWQNEAEPSGRSTDG